MVTGTLEQTPFKDSPDTPGGRKTFKAFFVCPTGDGLSTELISVIRHLGEIIHVKLSRNYRDIIDFIKAFEPETITLEQQQLCARGLDTLFPILTRKNVPVVFQLTKPNRETGYLCIGIEFSNVKGDYYGRLVPAMKTLFEKACLQGG